MSMTQSLLILVAIVGLPMVVLLVLRINATLVFLSLCLGDVLTQFVANDAGSFASLFKSHTHGSQLTTTPSGIKLALLLLPVVLTAVFMVHTVRGSKQFLNILPAAGVGLLGALLGVPLLGGSATQVMQSTAWQQLVRLQDLVVGLSALFCLLVLWLQRPKTGGSKGKEDK